MNALSYIKNVGKSFGYSAVDVIKSYNTASVSFAKNTKEFVTELYQSIRDFKENASDRESEKTFKGDLRDVVSDMKKNIIEDLKSGNFYNKQRAAKAEDELATSMFSDFGDFDDFDFEFDDDTESSDSDDFAAEKSLNSELEEALDTVGQKSSSAVAMATIESADYIVQSGKQNSKAIYALTNRGFNQISTGLAAVNSNISNLVQLGEPLTAHMQNSSLFYTKSSEYQEKALSLLENISKNTTPVETKRETSYAKNTIGSLLSDGTLDISSYINMVKENTKSFVDMAKGALDMAGGVKGMGAVAAGSPLQMIPKGIINALLPKAMKETMKTFDKSLQGFFGSVLGNLKDKSFGDGAIGMAMEFAKSYLLPQSGYKNDLSVRGYEKGKVDWDGKSRKSLLEVIPTQLSKIVAAITGEPEQRYDFETGRWKTIHEVRKEFEQDRIRYANMAGGDYIDFLKDTISQLQQAQTITAEQAKSFKDQITDFNYKAFHSNDSEFTKIMKDDFNYGKYGLTKEGWEFIRNANKAAESQGKYDLRMGYNASIYENRDMYGDARRRQEEDGSNLALQLYNGSILSEKDEKKKSRTVLGSDEYNNDIFFYLQGIYKHSKHLSDNLGSLPSGSGRGSRGNRHLKPIEELQVNIKDDDKKDIDKKNSVIESLSEIQSTSIKDAVNSIFGEDGVVFSSKLSPELQEYIDRKQAALEAGLAFEEDKEKEDTIKFHEQVRNSSESIGSGIKDKIKNNKFIKPITSTIEKFLKLPSDVVTDLLNAGMVSMKRVLYGEKPEAEEKGIFGYMSSGMKHIFEKLDKKVEDIFGKSPSEIFKDGINKVLGEKGDDGKRNGGVLSNFANSTSEALGSAKDWLKDAFIGSAANGRKVTKTGMIAVSEGEMVIPAEYNPFYNKPVNKRSQIYNESKAVNKFYGMYNNGGTVGNNDQENAEGKTSKFKIADNSALGILKMLAKEGVTTLGNGTKSVFNDIMGSNREKKQNEDDRSKIQKILDSALPEIKTTKGAMGAGALIGAGVSLLTGTMVGPVLGAGIGAATGLVIKSEKVNKLLFGDDEKDGLMPEKISNFVRQNLDKTAKGAVVGGAAGLFLGSPMLGMLLGSTAGYISSSEKAKKWLFGDEENEGIIKKKMQDKLKKAMPNISAGALAGLVVGPFGSPITNLIAGSAIGYATTNEKFKAWIFGDEENDKEGLIPLIKRKVLNPIVGIFDKLSESIKHHVRNLFSGVSKVITGVIGKFLKNSVKRVGETRLGRAAKKVGNAVVKAPIHAVGRAVRGIDSRLERSALRRGYSIKDRELGRNLSAQERLDKMQERGMSLNGKYATVNKLIASMSDNPEHLDEFNKLVKQMTDPTKAFDEKLGKTKSKARDLLNNAESTSGRNIFKLLKKGKYDEARSLLSSATDINDIQKQKILETINEYEQTSKDRESTKDNVEEARKRLVERSGLKGVLDVHGVHTKELFNLKNSDMRNIQDLIKDEQNILKGKEEKSSEEKVEQTVTEEIPDILKDIASILAGNNRTKKKYNHSRMSNSNIGTEGTSQEGKSEVERATDKVKKSNEPQNGDTRSSVDSTTGGTIKEIYRDPPGIWEPDNTDTGTKSSLLAKNKIVDGLSALPLIGPSMEKVGGMFTELSNSIFNKENDEPSLLKTLLTGAVTKISGFFDESNGIVSSIRDFFTGGTQGNNFFKTLAGDEFLTRTAKGLFGFTTLGAMFNDDSFLNKMASKFSYGSKDKTINGTLKDEDNKSYIYKSGKFVQMDDNSKDASGKKLVSDNNASHAEALETLGKKTRDNLVRGTITGKGSVASTIAKRSLYNTIPGSKGVVEKATRKAKTGFKTLSQAGDALKAGNIDDAAKGIGKVVNPVKMMAGDNIVSGIKKLQQGLMKVPGIKSIVKKIDFEKLTSKLVKTTEKYITKAGTKAAKMASSIAKIVPGLNVAFFVVDFTTGYQDASATFKVKNPSFGQKVASALIRSLKNLVPIVGTFIPDHALVDLVVEIIAPALGITPKKLMAQREEAQKEVDEYNKKNDTDYNWEEYNKKVLGNYTWTEKIQNGVINFKNNLRAKWHNFKVDIDEKGGLKKIIGDKVSGFGKGVKDKISSIGKTFSDGVSSIAKGFSDSYKTLFKGATEVSILSKKGDIGGIWKYNLDKTKGEKEGEEGSTNAFTKGIFTAYKVMNMPGALISWAGGKIKDLWESFSDPIKKDWDTLTKGIETLKTKASDGDVGGVFSSKINLSGGILSPIFQVGFFINKIFNTIGALIHKLANPIMKFFDNPLFKKIANFVGGGGYKTEDDSGSGAGNSGLIPAYQGAGSSGFVSQVDPKFSNKKIGNSNVGSMGCGPASALMAVSNKYNTEESAMDEAIDVANKHQTKGGTDISYFADYFNKKGFNAKYYKPSGGSSSLVNDIKNGNNVVLMGQDKKNYSKERSPFGPNNHYVVATGMDKDGSIIVNDPELNRPGKKYRPSILKNVKAAVSAAGARINGVYNNHISLSAGDSGIKGSISIAPVMKNGKRTLNGKPFPDYKDLRVDATTKRIWAFLKSKGCTDECAAGIMGNLQQESTCNPTLVQYSSMNAAGLCQWENYKFRESRWREMANYCAKHGKEWTDLDCQLAFMWKELISKDVDDRIKAGYTTRDGYHIKGLKGGYKALLKLKDVKRACDVFEGGFERAGKPLFDKRYEFAAWYLKKFAGKVFEYTGGIKDSKIFRIDKKNKKNKNESSGGILDTIIGAFSNAFDTLFGKTTKAAKNKKNKKDEDVVRSVGGATWKRSKDPVSYMEDILGKIEYSQKGPRNPDQGSADCSSTVNWAIKKAGGPDIGGYSGAQYNSKKLKTIWYNKGKIPKKIPDGLARNDVLFFSRDTSYPDGVGHVGLYMGDGKYIDHGSGMGPKIKDFNTETSKFIKASRVKGMTRAVGIAVSDTNKKRTKSFKEKKKDYKKFLNLPQTSSVGIPWTEYKPGQGTLRDEKNYTLWKEYYFPSQSTGGKYWKDYTHGEGSTIDEMYYSKYLESAKLYKALFSSKDDGEEEDKTKSKNKNKKKNKKTKGGAGSGLDLRKIIDKDLDEEDDIDSNTENEIVRQFNRVNKIPSTEKETSSNIIPFVRNTSLSRSNDTSRITPLSTDKLSKLSEDKNSNIDNSLLRRIEERNNITKILPDNRPSISRQIVDRSIEILNKKNNEFEKNEDARDKNMLLNKIKTIASERKEQEVINNNNEINIDKINRNIKNISESNNKFTESNSKQNIERIKKIINSKNNTTKEAASNNTSTTKISTNKDRVTQLSNSGISKESAATFKIIISLIEQLVGNTKSIQAIYDLLNEKLSSDNKTEKPNTANSTNITNNDMIERSLSSLKDMMDEILAS